ncbi:hypothetical protein DID80_04400, partial [Candidatus Marinamargulisbacteria bacterium SCGC AAA071-K20]
LRAATSGPLKDASTTVRSRFTNLFSFGPRSATTSPSVSVSYFADASHEERANLAPELSPPGMVKTLANKITGTTAPQAILTKNLTEIFQSRIDDVKISMNARSIVPGNRGTQQQNSSLDVKGVSFTITSGGQSKCGYLPTSLYRHTMSLMASKVHHGDVGVGTKFNKEEMRSILNGPKGFSPPELVDSFLDNLDFDGATYTLDNIVSKYTEFRNEVFASPLTCGDVAFEDTATVTTVTRRPENAESFNNARLNTLEEIEAFFSMLSEEPLNFAVHNTDIYLLAKNKNKNKTPTSIQMSDVTASRKNSGDGAKLNQRDLQRIQGVFKKLGINIGDDNPFMAYSRLQTTIIQMAEGRPTTAFSTPVAFTSGVIIEGLAHTVPETKVHTATISGNRMTDTTIGKTVSKKGARGFSTSVKVVSSSDFKKDSALHTAVQKHNTGLYNMDSFVGGRPVVFAVELGERTEHFVEIPTKDGGNGRCIVSVSDLVWLASGKPVGDSTTVDTDAADMSAIEDVSVSDMDWLSPDEAQEVRGAASFFNGAKTTDSREDALTIKEGSLTAGGVTLNFNDQTEEEKGTSSSSQERTFTGITYLRRDMSSVVSIMASNGSVMSRLISSGTSNNFSSFLTTTEKSQVKDFYNDLGMALNAIASERPVPSSLADSLVDRLTSLSSISKGYDGESGRKVDISTVFSTLATTISKFKGPNKNSLQARIAGVTYDSSSKTINLKLSKYGTRREMGRLLGSVTSAATGGFRGVRASKSHDSPIKTVTLPHPSKFTEIPDHSLVKEAIRDIKASDSEMSDQEAYGQFYESVADTYDNTGGIKQDRAHGKIKQMFTNSKLRKAVKGRVEATKMKNAELARQEKNHETVIGQFATVKKAANKVTTAISNGGTIKFGRSMTNAIASAFSRSDTPKRLELITQLSTTLSRISDLSLKGIEPDDPSFEALRTISAADLSIVSTTGKISSADGSKLTVAILQAALDSLTPLISVMSEDVIGVTTMGLSDFLGGSDVSVASVGDVAPVVSSTAAAAPSVILEESSVVEEENSFVEYSSGQLDIQEPRIQTRVMSLNIMKAFSDHASGRAGLFTGSSEKLHISIDLAAANSFSEIDSDGEHVDDRYEPATPIAVKIVSSGSGFKATLESSKGLSSDDLSDAKQVITNLNDCLKTAVPQGEISVKIEEFSDELRLLKLARPVIEARELGMKDVLAMDLSVVDEAPFYADESSFDEMRPAQLVNARMAREQHLSALNIVQLFTTDGNTSSRSGLLHGGDKMHMSLNLNAPSEMGLGAGSEGFSDGAMPVALKVTSRGGHLRIELEKSTVSDLSIIDLHAAKNLVRQMNRALKDYDINGGTMDADMATLNSEIESLAFETSNRLEPRTYSMNRKDIEWRQAQTEIELCAYKIAEKFITNIQHGNIRLQRGKTIQVAVDLNRLASIFEMKDGVIDSEVYQAAVRSDAAPTVMILTVTADKYGKLSTKLKNSISPGFADGSLPKSTLDKAYGFAAKFGTVLQDITIGDPNSRAIVEEAIENSDDLLLELDFHIDTIKDIEKARALELAAVAKHERIEQAVNQLESHCMLTSGYCDAQRSAESAVRNKQLDAFAYLDGLDIGSLNSTNEINSAYTTLNKMLDDATKYHVLDTQSFKNLLRTELENLSDLSKAIKVLENGATEEDKAKIDGMREKMKTQIDELNKMQTGITNMERMDAMISEKIDMYKAGIQKQMELREAYVIAKEDDKILVKTKNGRIRKLFTRFTRKVARRKLRSRTKNASSKKNVAKLRAFKAEIKAMIAMSRSEGHSSRGAYQPLTKEARTQAKRSTRKQMGWATDYLKYVYPTESQFINRISFDFSMVDGVFTYAERPSSAAP